MYDARPYVCRTQGLPLAMFEEDEDGEVHERRSICELNLEGEPLDALELEECWLIGPTELELQSLQAGQSNPRNAMVAALFHRQIHSPIGRHLTITSIAAHNRRGPFVLDDLRLHPRQDDTVVQLAHVVTDELDPVRIVAGQIGLNQLAGDQYRLIIRRAAGAKQLESRILKEFV